MKFVLPIRALILSLLFCISTTGFAASFEGKLSELLFYEDGDLIYVYFGLHFIQHEKATSEGVPFRIDDGVRRR